VSEPEVTVGEAACAELVGVGGVVAVVVGDWMADDGDASIDGVEVISTASEGLVDVAVALARVVGEACFSSSFPPLLHAASDSPSRTTINQ
jgi:hypothetical protein